MKYVCGFMMSFDLSQFLLIRKNRPEWAKGKWNGIGGKIEYVSPLDGIGLGHYETPHEAMIREFYEETGIITNKKRWHCYHIEEFITGPDQNDNTVVYYFVAFGDEPKRNWLGKSPTDEEVKTHSLIDLFWDQKDYMYNLPYLLHMIIYNFRAGFLMKLNPQGVNTK